MEAYNMYLCPAVATAQIPLSGGDTLHQSSSESHLYTDI